MLCTVHCSHSAVGCPCMGGPGCPIKTPKAYFIFPLLPPPPTPGSCLEPAGVPGTVELQTFAGPPMGRRYPHELPLSEEQPVALGTAAVLV